MRMFTEATASTPQLDTCSHTTIYASMEVISVSPMIRTTRTAAVRCMRIDACIARRGLEPEDPLMVCQPYSIRHCNAPFA